MIWNSIFSKFRFFVKKLFQSFSSCDSYSQQTMTILFLFFLICLETFRSVPPPPMEIFGHTFPHCSVVKVLLKDERAEVFRSLNGEIKFQHFYCVRLFTAHTRACFCGIIFYRTGFRLNTKCYKLEVIWKHFGPFSRRKKRASDAN